MELAEETTQVDPETDAGDAPRARLVWIDERQVPRARLEVYVKAEKGLPWQRARIYGGTMRLRVYQYGELFGIVLLLASTATQLFYLEPLKREIEWRLVAFNTQQSAQIQLRAVYDNQVALLKLMNAPAEQVTATEAKRDDTLAQYKNSDANIADFMFAKEGVENYLEVIVIALFALGSLMAGLGRALEMSAARTPRGKAEAPHQYREIQPA